MFVVGVLFLALGYFGRDALGRNRAERAAAERQLQEHLRQTGKAIRGISFARYPTPPRELTGDAIEAVLFDLGGVLLASPFDAIARYERERGMPAGTIRRINSADPHTNAWARLERGEVDMETFAALFEAEARSHGVEVGAFDVLALLFGDVRPKMVTAVDRLRDAGLRVGVVSNTPCRLPRSGPVGEVLGRFDVVVESFVVGLRKPDPGIYRLALGELGVAAAATVFLDDLGVNLKTARELGMRTIKVVDPGDALRELAELTGVQVWR